MVVRRRNGCFVRYDGFGDYNVYRNFGPLVSGGLAELEVARIDAVSHDEHLT